MTHSHLVEKSEKMIGWLNSQIDGINIPSDDRNRFSSACFHVALEYQHAIVLLIKERLYGAAFTLLRSVIESYVRGIWLHRCATKEDIKNFTNGNERKYVNAASFSQICLFSLIGC